MVPHAREEPLFTYDLKTERNALLFTKDHRGIPSKRADGLLTATWNLTNFGVQQRTDDDLALMAEVISWFDFVAVQEMADDLADLRRLMSHLPVSYRAIFPTSAATMSAPVLSMTAIRQPGSNLLRR